MSFEGTLDKLTERQRCVVEGVAHRKTIKKIASELGLSPSTVNEHLSAAKKNANVRSTDELVALFFLDNNPATARTIDRGVNFRVRHSDPIGQQAQQDNSGFMLLADSAPMDRTLFVRPTEPSVVPEELDGHAAVLPRLMQIAKLTGLILAAAVLALVALQSVTGLMGQ